MKGSYPKRLSSNGKIIWILVQLMIIGSGYYLFVYNSFGYKSWNDVIGMTMVAIAVIFIFMTLMNSPHPNKWYEIKSLKFYIPSVLFALAAIYVLHTRRTEYYNQQALIPTLAEIIGKEKVQIFSRRVSNRIRTYATIRCFDNGHEIIQRISDYDGRYSIGHYVPIKYSENQPDLFRINFEYKE